MREKAVKNYVRHYMVLDEAGGAVPVRFVEAVFELWYRIFQ